jgi:hypothetical protein
VNIRTQQAYKLRDIQRIKERDCVHVIERGQNFRTLLARNARTAFSFE